MNIMKSIVSFFTTLILLLLLTTNTFGQALKSYQLTSKGDTINRVDNSQRKQGPWISRLEELRGEPGFEEQGYYLNDKKEGAWRKFNLDGDLIAEEFYRWGNRDGRQQYFTRNGGLYREESWKAMNPLNPYDTIVVPDLDNPNVMVEKIIKQESAEVRHGTWSYFDPSSGQVMKTEKFFYGKLEGPKTASHALINADTIKTKATQLPKTKPKVVEAFEKSNNKKLKAKT
jgi:hypothetical protein